MTKIAEMMLVDKIASKPPRWVKPSMAAMWAEVVRGSQHTSYAGATCHFRSRLKKALIEPDYAKKVSKPRGLTNGTIRTSLVRHGVLATQEG